MIHELLSFYPFYVLSIETCPLPAATALCVQGVTLSRLRRFRIEIHSVHYPLQKEIHFQNNNRIRKTYRSPL